MRIFGAGVIFAAAAVAAQTPATPQPPPQTFRSAAEIVEVDVRVFKDGRFVTDLGPDDFEITEDGVAQKIRSVVLIGAASAAPVTSSASDPSGAPTAPAASPSMPPAVWLFVFDTPHLTTGGLQRTREAVETFFDQRWHQGDIGGIVFDGKMANNRLTSVREELRAAVQSIRLPGDLRSRQLEMTRDWPRFQDEYEVIRIAVDQDRETMRVVATRACSDDPDACKRVPPDLAIHEKASRLTGDMQRAALNTLSTVQALSNGLARLPGPKTVVFVSEGFVAEKLESAVRQAAGDAARAGAHIYAIDARGLNKGSQATIFDQPYAESTIGATTHFDAQVDGTNSLAVDTGGFAIRNENNFSRALDEIRQDAGTYYIIGYTPANTTFDGKYRAIAVSVRRPGVKVRARRGYLALPPAQLLPPGAKRPPAAPEASRTDVAPEASRTDAASSAAPGAGPLPAATSPTFLVPEAAPAVARLAAIGSGGVDHPAAVAGWAAYQRGDLETAARELSTTAAAADARPWVLYALGLSHYALRHYQEAAASWERVRRTQPDFEPIYFALADAYSLQHDEGTAIKALRDGELRWPADPEIADAIGVIQIRRGAIDAAIESFQRATAVAPAEGLGYFNLARAYQMRLMKSQRYDPQLQKWIGGDEDRRRALANFQKYLDLGGPYERQAREAIAALQWK
jgi:VWFA-related protein